MPKRVGKVDIFTMSEILPELHKSIIEEHEKSGEELARRVEANHKRDFQVIKQNSSGDGFGNAQMQSFIEIKKSYTKGVQVFVHSYVTNSFSNNPHDIFHYISGGTKERIATKVTPMFFYDNAPRTTPNKLSMLPASSSGKLRFVAAGTRIKGIKPRNYYRKINKNSLGRIKPQKEGWYVKIEIREKK